MYIIFALFLVIAGAPSQSAYAQQATNELLTMEFEDVRGIALRAGLLLEENLELGLADAEIATNLLHELPALNDNTQISALSAPPVSLQGRLRTILDRRRRTRIGNFVLRLKRLQHLQQSREGSLLLVYGILAEHRPGVLSFEIPGLTFTGYAPAQDDRARNLPSNDTLPLGSFLTGQAHGFRLFAWTLPLGNGGTAGVRADILNRLRISGRALLARQLSLLLQTEGSVVRTPLGNHIYLVAIARIAGRLELIDSPLDAFLGAASVEGGAGLDGQWGDTRGHLRVYGGPEVVIQPQSTTVTPALNITADVDL